MFSADAAFASVRQSDAVTMIYLFPLLRRKDLLDNRLLRHVCGYLALDPDTHRGSALRPVRNSHAGKNSARHRSKVYHLSVSTEVSKALSKEFPLMFEEEGFSLKPPKLDGWAKDKGVERNISP